MQSTASQAAIGESDAISDTLRGFQSQLQDLYSQTSSLIEQMRSRDGNIRQSSEMLERLESRVNEMVATTKSLETSIQTPDASEEDTARELHDLISERGDHNHLSRGMSFSNNVVCATSKGSNQPAHTRSLIRAFASRLNIL